MVTPKMIKPTLPQGTLVQIKDEVLADDTTLGNRIAIDGYLWIIDRLAGAPVAPRFSIWYWCRSVATGNMYDFMDSEFTVAEQEQAEDTHRNWDNEADQHDHDRSNDR